MVGARQQAVAEDRQDLEGALARRRFLAARSPAGRSTAPSAPVCEPRMHADHDVFEDLRLGNRRMF